ncbi:hypothetical protein Tco_0794839 [Tanacetum coccineum]
MVAASPTKLIPSWMLFPFTNRVNAPIKVSLSKSKPTQALGWVSGLCGGVMMATGWLYGVVVAARVVGCAREWVVVSRVACVGGDAAETAGGGGGKARGGDFVSPPSCDRNRGGFNDYDSEVGSVFEEEFIGPTLVVQNTIGIPSFEQQPLNTEDEKTKPVHCPSTSPRVSRSVNIGSTNSFFEETRKWFLWSLGQASDDSCDHPIEVKLQISFPNGPPSP